MNTAEKLESERFQSEAYKYAAYLETPEGRLRSDLAFANLQDFLPSQPKAIWRQRRIALPPSGDENPCTEAGCDYLRQIACKPC